MSVPDPTLTDWVPLNRIAAPTLSGTLANRPAASTAGLGTLYYTTDTGETYRSDGTAWTLVVRSVPNPVVNGQWVKGIGGAAVWSAIAQADLPLTPYGTSLPASPFDGQKAILVDSTTNPSYQWRFRYNAGSSSLFKWEFVGGFPAIAQSFADEQQLTDATWRNFTTPCAFTVPRAGDYFFTGTARCFNNTGANISAALGINGNPAVYTTIQTGWGEHIHIDVFYANTSASTVENLQMQSAAGSGNCFWSIKLMTVTPKRVS